MQVQELTASEARVCQREATIRQLFDAVPDIVTLTRFSDGKLLEVNREFLQRSGLSRQQALRTTVVQADAWVRPQERDNYIQRMKTEGRVRNLEVELGSMASSSYT
jgi:PAS domain-containing protein